MCLVEGLAAQYGGEALGFDPFGRKRREEKSEKKLQERDWARQDANKAADRAHAMALADKGFGRGNWRQGNVNSNRDSLRSQRGQSGRQRDRAY